jgi:hypothetical protein
MTSVRLLKLVWIVAFAFTIGNALESASPTVTIQQGIVQGFTNGNLSQFLGIPFAAPP